MFRNAGGKIKVLAIVMFWLMVIAGTIFGFALSGDTEGISLLFIPGSFLVGWLSNLALYAFGELCENVYEINERQRRNAAEQPVSRSLFSSSPAPEPSPISTDNDTVKCPSCGKPTAADSKYCLHCGDMIS